MPDLDGRLTPEDNLRIETWLQTKGRIASCWVCGFNDWAIGTHVMSAKVHLSGPLAFGGPTYPMVFVVCRNCAHTMTFMASAIGILEGPD